MRKLITLLITSLLILPVVAQQDTSTPLFEEPQQTATPDDFELRATELVQTSTAQAGGSPTNAPTSTVDPNVPTETPGSFERRATEIVGTSTAEALLNTGESSTSQADDGISQPTNFSLLAVAMVVVILVVVGGGFAFIVSQNNEQK